YAEESLLESYLATATATLACCTRRTVVRSKPVARLALRETRDRDGLLRAEDCFLECNVKIVAEVFAAPGPVPRTASTSEELPENGLVAVFETVHEIEGDRSG